ncbi:GerAB/ArcD/ProY family transporter [Virgibacillus ndiopensis]|uniref:GerAB/ArcD/ProY family transporter n=1 Tax=Virgibacillus ndiopensis TaxID=2004408 RepID=UPI000C08411E|nr:endospore germination permease [Virgibacillus ndiopensis]
MKLSRIQVVWIIVTTLIIAMIGLRITPAIQIAKQDAWLSMLVGGIVSIPLTLLVVHLSILHPNRTLIEFGQTVLGKWLGRTIVLPYLISWYILPAVLLRSFGDFIHLIILDQTPVWIIMFLLISVVTYLTYSSGITGIGRFCALVGPIIVFTLLVSFILNVRNVEWHHLFPIYTDSGWIDILKGSLPPAFWFAGPFILLVIVAFMEKPKKAISTAMLGIGITVFMVSAATLMVLLVFGPDLAAKLRFSFFVSIRTIDILDFIQNIDILIVFIWVFGVTAQLSLYFFIASYETAQWFKVKDWRKFIWFGAPAIFVMAIFIPNEATITLFSKFWTSVVFPICGIGIPFLLWTISVIKRKSVKL